MPIDDLRTRSPAARPVADAADDLDHDGHLDDDEPSPTPERLAEIEAAHNAEAVRRLKDLDEGRVQGIPLEDALAFIFAEPTPEELAELPPRRARRAASR